MVQRCTNPKRKDFQRYGGRGISVCARWHLFENFLSDVGERPEGMQLDRIDNNKNYEPANVRWVSATENACNKSNNVKIFFNGKYFTISQLAKELGISRALMRYRLKNGWNLETISKLKPSKANRSQRKVTWASQPKKETLINQ